MGYPERHGLAGERSAAGQYVHGARRPIAGYDVIAGPARLRQLDLAVLGEGG
jgi:hypothetical protein